MDYLVNSTVCPATLLYISAITSIYVSSSSVWVTLNCILPIITCCTYAIPESLDVSYLGEYELPGVYQIATTLEHWLIFTVSICFTHQTYGWTIIPISIGIFSVFHIHLYTELLKDAVFTVAVFKLIRKSLIVLPIALIAATSYNTRKPHSTGSYYYRLYSWQWYMCVTAILCIASFSV